MEAPPSHPGELIEPTLGMREVLEGLRPAQREDKRPSLVCAFQHGQYCRDRWTMCALAFFVRALGIVQIR